MAKMHRLPSDASRSWTCFYDASSESGTRSGGYEISRLALGANPGLWATAVLVVECMFKCDKCFCV